MGFLFPVLVSFVLHLRVGREGGEGGGEEELVENALADNFSCTNTSYSCLKLGGEGKKGGGMVESITRLRLLRIRSFPEPSFNQREKRRKKRGKGGPPVQNSRFRAICCASILLRAAGKKRRGGREQRYCLYNSFFAIL